MAVTRLAIALIVAIFVTYLFASIFYTSQVIAGQASFGATYTLGQQLETYLANFLGLWLYGAMIAIALSAGFLVAFFVKKILKPLAPIAYPLAGATAIYALLILVEAQLGGGAGIIGGARTPLGIALQSLAGAIGGFAFALISTRR